MKEEDILRFISGQMDSAEKDLFTADMNSNDELKRAVEHSLRIKSLVDQDTAVFSNNVRSVIESNRVKKRPVVLWIAASVTAVLVSVLAYLFFTSSQTTDELVASYLDPFPDVVTNRTSENLLIDLSAYNRGNYIEAAVALQKQLDEQKEPFIALYLAVSYLILDRTVDALSTFDKIDIESSILREDFIWYKSLALIKMQRKEEAEMLLRRLKKSQTNYSSKSSQLLKDLE